MEEIVLKRLYARDVKFKGKKLGSISEEDIKRKIQTPLSDFEHAKEVTLYTADNAYLLHIDNGDEYESVVLCKPELADIYSYFYDD